jgi:tRNA A-37 threonylcarbamoyl transferase component Bud32
MDFIDGEYHDSKRSPAIASYETEVQEKVTSHHEAGFVHGDIRSVNM